MNRSELIMRRVNVREFINADPISLVISRPGAALKNENTGGFTQQPSTPLQPQKARIVLNKRRYNPGLVNAEAGDIPNTDYLIIGNYTLNLQKDDEFFWKDELYKVVGIHAQRIESVLAAIDLKGPVNRNA